MSSEGKFFKQQNREHNLWLTLGGLGMGVERLTWQNETFLCCSMYCLFCVVLCIVCFVSFCVLFVCQCVLYYCHRVATQLQLTNISISNSRLYQQVETAQEVRGGLSLWLPRRRIRWWRNNFTYSSCLYRASTVLRHFITLNWCTQL